MNPKTKTLPIFLFLLIIPLSYSTTLQELINSYNYTYTSDRINVVNVSHFYEDWDSDTLYDALLIQIDVENEEGGYTFTGDLYRDHQLITIGGSGYYLYIGPNSILLAIYNTKSLPGGVYNLTLTIQKDYLTVYRKESQYSFYVNASQNEQPDISVGINSYGFLDMDEDEKYEFLFINTTINSTTFKNYEINALIKDNSSINSKNYYDLMEGTNEVILFFEGIGIRKERLYNATLYSITVKDYTEGIQYTFDFNYSLDYNFYDFDAEQSTILNTYSDRKIDLNDNNLSEFLEINISLDIKEAGIYSIELELDDLYNNYVKMVNKEFDLNMGEQTINFRINGTDMYNSKVNGPYLLDYVQLSKDSLILDSISKPYITNNYTYDEFERPLMPDLVIKNIEQNDGNITVNIANEGDSYAFAFDVNIFDDNFTSIKEILIDYLSPGDSKNFSYPIDTSNIILIYTIVDYDNNIEEVNESNNLLTKDIISNLIELNLSLTSNWNIISLPLNPQNKTMNNIFKDYSKLFTYNMAWQEISNNSEISETKAYWINSLTNQTLTIEGTEFTYPLNFTLTEGWNLISYPSLNTTLINESLKDVNYSIIYTYNDSKWLSYIPVREDSLNTLKYLTPFYGYWIKVPQNTTWTFDGVFR